MTSDKIEEMKARKIVKKYGGDFSNVIRNSSQAEMEVLLMYATRKANEKQQQLVADADALAVA